MADSLLGTWTGEHDRRSRRPLRPRLRRCARALRRHLWKLVFTILAGCLWGHGRPAVAQHQESFEAPETSWELADRDCGIRLTQHTRTFEQAHSGQASELVRFHAGNGTFVHMVHPMPSSRIIDELSISVWIKSNRPGLQLSVRAVLPRATDPRTGGPLTTLIRGEPYKQTGTWEKLSIEGPSRLLARQVPLLRSQFGSDVDAREAYADLLVLNAYTGAGQAEIWIDDLEVTGLVSTLTSSSDAPAVQLMSRSGAPPWHDHSADISPGQSTGTSPDNEETGLQGSIFFIGGRPCLIRAIDYNGEPFSWLKSLGFNATRLPTPPTAEQLREAEESDFWLIAPPPTLYIPQESDTTLTRVLAWNLGEDLAADRVDATRQLSQKLRRAAGQNQRALICGPREATWNYSRLVDFVVLDPPGPNSSLPLGDFGTWYLNRSRLTQLGEYFWASVRTQVSPTVMGQMQAMGIDTQDPLSLEPEQIRLQTYHAIASGARGLLFRSQSRLDQSDRMAVLRAKTLQWVNQELSIFEPWAATGDYDGEVETEDPAVRVSVLKTSRSRMLLVIRRTSDSQYVAGADDPGPVSFEVHDVPETDEAYRVSAEGLQRIEQKRGTGVRVTLKEAKTVTAVVLSQDRLAINFLARQIEAARHQRDELLGEIAAQMYAVVVETHNQVAPFAPSANSSNLIPFAENALSRARSELQHFQQLVEGGGHERAHEFLYRGLHQLAVVRNHDWGNAAGAFPSPVSSPLCVSFFSLPAHYALGQRLRGAAWGPNALAAGDFENLQHMQSTGWRNLISGQADVSAAVELSLHQPQSGRTALRMQCWPVNVDQMPAVVESPPVAITSAPIPIRREQMLRIHGWVRVPNAIQSSMDGLLIYDSLGGKDLALRIKLSEDWREFTLYRMASRDGELTLSFALTGFGDAWLDNVSVTPLELPGASVSATNQTPAIRH